MGVIRLQAVSGATINHLLHSKERLEGGFRWRNLFGFEIMLINYIALSIRNTTDRAERNASAFIGDSLIKLGHVIRRNGIGAQQH